MFPMAFLPYGSEIRSHVLFLSKASISSCIAVIHRDLFGLLTGSWKVDGSPSSESKQYTTVFCTIYSECQSGGLVSWVDVRTSKTSGSTGASFCGVA